MAKVIIGIHGLANKPEEDVLSDWWETSIKEGLKINTQYQQPFKFEMVWWAGCIYKDQVHTNKHWPCDKSYNREPYLPANGPLAEHKKSVMDRTRIFGRSIFGGVLDKLGTKRAFKKLTKSVLEKMARDLNTYYHEENLIHDPLVTPVQMLPARNVLQSRLRRVIRDNKNNEIMVIAHSMGSIIAYDVIRDIGMLGQESDENEGISVPYFVTIGSPLGISEVKSHVVRERDYDKKNPLRTPSIVTKSWVNFSDMGDIVAVDAKLSDEYKENKNHVRVQDILVNNEYVGSDGKSPNKHKSYGYLRAPEVSKHIKSFLEN
jgi:hypothetical protein